MRRALELGGLVLAISGCAQRPPPQHSQAMETSARMLAQLGKLEADLAAADTAGTTFSLLVERHGQAEQVACRVTDEHIEEIHRLDVARQKQMLERHKKGLAVARR
jgi:hypothetical protein